MSVHCLLYHVFKQDYNPADNRLLLFVMSMCFIFFNMCENVNLLNCVKALVGITILSESFFVFNMVNEICDNLGISAFKTKPKDDNLSSLLN